MEKITSTFKFTEPIEKVSDEPDPGEAFVILTIDYEHETFTVTPGCGTKGQGFVFKNNPTQIRKWFAVLRAIQSAIRFAKGELNIE